MSVPPPETGSATATTTKSIEEKKRVVIRFAGDSGDGMQLTGTQFTTEAALAGNDIGTLPDFPAEIRAPTGTLAGVSAFQLNFSSEEVLTPGDDVDVLVAMNPAALKTNLADLSQGGILIVNSEQFGERICRRPATSRTRSRARCSSAISSSRSTSPSSRPQLSKTWASAIARRFAAGISSRSDSSRGSTTGRSSRRSSGCRRSSRRTHSSSKRTSARFAPAGTTATRRKRSSSPTR